MGAKQSTAKTQAKKVADKVKKSVRKASHKVHHKPRFFRPKTKTVRRSAKLLKNLRKHTPQVGNDDPRRTILYPVTSDKNVQRMELENTLSFIVDLKANKNTVANAFFSLYKVKVRSVNTLVRPDGKKKAFIRLATGADALKVASKIG